MRRHAKPQGHKPEHAPAYSPANGKPGCNGKRMWPNFATAQRMAERTHRQAEEPMDAYHCKHCGRFHVGSRRSIKQR